MSLIEFVRLYSSVTRSTQRRLLRILLTHGSMSKRQERKMPSQDVRKLRKAVGRALILENGSYKLIAQKRVLRWEDEAIVVYDDGEHALIKSQSTALRATYLLLDEGRDVVYLSKEIADKVRPVFPFLRHVYRGRIVYPSDSKLVTLELDGSEVRLLQPIVYSKATKRGLTTYFIPWVDQEGRNHDDKTGDAVLLKVIRRGEFVALACGTCASIERATYSITEQRSLACAHLKILGGLDLGLDLTREDVAEVKVEPTPQIQELPRERAEEVEELVIRIPVREREPRIRWDVEVNGVKGKLLDDGRMLVYDPNEFVGVGVVDLDEGYCITEHSYGCIHIKEAMKLLDLITRRTASNLHAR